MKYLLLAVLFTLGYFVQAEEITREEKLEKIKTVYSKIYTAATGSAITPELVLVDEELNMASMGKDENGKPLMKFEEKAFDVCNSFGAKSEDAIAFILGHEIAHHVLNHDWSDDFRYAYSMKELAREIVTHDKDTISRKRFETQADERGGIFAYLAGYNPSPMIENLLTSLYKEYNLVDNPKYPSLKDRIELAKEQDNNVQTFIKVFENANYALMVENYEVAITCYEYITEKSQFKSREILNNLGTAYFLLATSKIDSDELKYIYPVELDLESRITARGSKGMGEKSPTELLNLAKAYFKEAIQLDEEYATGYINLACVQSVLKDYYDAEGSVRKAIKYSKEENSLTAKNAKLVRAIINDLDPDGDKELTQSILEDLSNSHHILADINLEIYNGALLSEFEAELPISWMNAGIESVERNGRPRKLMIKDGLDNYSFNALRSVPAEQEETVKLLRRDKLIIDDFEFSRSFSTPYIDNGLDKYLFFHATKETFTGDVGGVSLDSDLETVISKMGSPNSVITAKQGEIILYRENNVMFELSPENRVKKIIVWREDLE